MTSMVDFFVSSFSQARASRKQILKLQASFTAAQSELSTGRVSDVVRSLGHKVGNLASLETRLGVIDTVISSNGNLKGRLESVELAVGGIQKAASDFRTNLVGARGGVIPHGDMAGHAKGFLETVKLFGNTTYAGRHVLSGSNGDQPAIGNFLGVGSDARAALSESFTNTFGVSPRDAASGAIPEAAMKAWLDTEFPKLFEADNWASMWATASGSPVEARIGEREIATLPAAVSDPALRKVVMASVLMLEFGEGRLGGGAFSQVLATAESSLDEGIQGLIGFEAENGSLMSRLDSASEALNLQKAIYSTEVSDIAEVDPAEVSLRIETLRARLEASYATTARLSKLSLVNYI